MNELLIFEDFLIIINVLLLLSTHEIGHWIVGKMEGINPKFTLSPWGLAVALDRPFSKRIYYLSGIIGSWITLIPALLVGEYFVWVTFVCSIGIGALDLLMFFCYSRIDFEKGTLHMEISRMHFPFFVKVGEESD